MIDHWCTVLNDLWCWLKPDPKKKRLFMDQLWIICVRMCVDTINHWRKLWNLAFQELVCSFHELMCDRSLAKVICEKFPWKVTFLKRLSTMKSDCEKSRFNMTFDSDHDKSLFWSDFWLWKVPMKSHVSKWLLIVHVSTIVTKYLDTRFLCCSVLQCVAVCCSVLQCAAVYCSVLQCVAMYCSVLQRIAVCCSVLQCVAVCCSVLQCVAVCCSVVQCVAVQCKNFWLATYPRVRIKISQ